MKDRKEKIYGDKIVGNFVPNNFGSIDFSQKFAEI